MVDATWGLGGVVGECAAGAAELVVEGDAGGEREQPQRDAGEQVAGCSGAVSFEGEQVFAGREDRLDPLPDRRAGAGLFVGASKPTRLSVGWGLPSRPGSDRARPYPWRIRAGGGDRGSALAAGFPCNYAVSFARRTLHRSAPSLPEKPRTCPQNPPPRKASRRSTRSMSYGLHERGRDLIASSSSLDSLAFIRRRRNSGGPTLTTRGLWSGGAIGASASPPSSVPFSSCCSLSRARRSRGSNRSSPFTSSSGCCYSGRSRIKLSATGSASSDTTAGRPTSQEGASSAAHARHCGADPRALDPESSAPASDCLRSEEASGDPSSTRQASSSGSGRPRSTSSSMRPARPGTRSRSAHTHGSAAPVCASVCSSRRSWSVWGLASRLPQARVSDSLGLRPPPPARRLIARVIERPDKMSMLTPVDRRARRRRAQRRKRAAVGRLAALAIVLIAAPIILAAGGAKHGSNSPPADNERLRAAPGHGRGCCASSGERSSSNTQRAGCRRHFRIHRVPSSAGRRCSSAGSRRPTRPRINRRAQLHRRTDRGSSSVGASQHGRGGHRALRLRVRRRQRYLAARPDRPGRPGDRERPVVGKLPAASSDSSAAAIGGTAYVVGGYTGTQWLDTIVA